MNFVIVLIFFLAVFQMLPEGICFSVSFLKTVAVYHLLNLCAFLTEVLEIWPNAQCVLV